MGIRLNTDNRHVYIKGASPNTLRALEHVTSYLVAGYMFSPAYRARPRRWDGREHLLKFSPKKGYKAPIGLLGDIVRTLNEMGKRYDMDTSGRSLNGPVIEVGWNPDVVLRPYQVEAVEAICQDGTWDYGSGLLKMPIRSGKTKTAAGIIHKIKRRALFIVPSQMLLHQTKASLEETLEGVTVGMIGDSEWRVDDITVATIQTLAKNAGGVKKVGKRTMRVPPTQQYKEIVKHFDLVIFDECHHLRGDVWHKVFMDFNCRYRIGLSATIHLDNDRENERGVIWLKACCGDIKHEVGTSFLIEQGYLMQQKVELVVCDQPEGYEDWKWCQELRDALIYENEWRNRKAVSKAQEKIAQGLKVLIVSNRHNQLAALHEMLVAEDVPHAIVIGNDRMDERKAKVQAFLDGEVSVLLGTVFGEGVDIPEIECVINAEGGRDVKAAIQRMRNMTPAAGKTEAVFVDFMDMTNKYFATHSAERLATYRSEHAFMIRIVE